MESERELGDRLSFGVYLAVYLLCGQLARTSLALTILGTGRPASGRCSTPTVVLKTD